MRYRLIQKFWSLFGDAFDVRGEDGRTLYRIRRQKSKDAERIAFEETGDLEVASVVIEPGGRWRISVRGEEAAVVTREALSALGWRLVIEAPGLDLEIRREGRRFTLIAAGVEVTSVRPSANPFRDSYAVEVAPGVEPLLALAVAAVTVLCDPN